MFADSELQQGANVSKGRACNPFFLWQIDILDRSELKRHTTGHIKYVSKRTACVLLASLTSQTLSGQSASASMAKGERFRLGPTVLLHHGTPHCAPVFKSLSQRVDFFVGQQSTESLPRASIWSRSVHSNNMLTILTKLMSASRMPLI